MMMLDALVSKRFITIIVARALSPNRAPLPHTVDIKLPSCISQVSRRTYVMSSTSADGAGLAGLGKFNVAALSRLVDGDCHETRRRLRAELSSELWTPRYNLTLPEQRELAYKRLKRVCDMEVISILDFERNPLNVFAVRCLRQYLSLICDPAASHVLCRCMRWSPRLTEAQPPRAPCSGTCLVGCTRSLVSYGWQCVTHCCAVAAGGTLLKLGTHHRELQPSIDRLETVGVSSLGCCADGTLEG